jgi:mRNA interferase RelE/StbE
MPKQAGDTSSEFRIFETDEFQKRQKKLPVHVARFVRSKLSEPVYPQLRQNPFLGPHIRKLKGYEPDTWRYRIGRFRVFYTVDQDTRIVAMLTIDDRRDAYR